MSKLLKQYEELKEKDPNKIYIFRVGIFYNILNEDARLVSKEIGLKITDLSPEIIKCGFPVATLEKYTNLLKEHDISLKLYLIKHLLIKILLMLKLYKKYKILI